LSIDVIMIHTGKLIVLEGLDGAGTTSQTKKVHDALISAGIESHRTAQPSKGPIGLLLRNFLTGSITGGTQEMFSLLFAADRVHHCDQEVGKMLSNGINVICDRWYHSSYVYQGAESPEMLRWIKSLNSRAMKPDLTMLLRVSPEIAAERRRLEGKAEELFDNIEMQKKVSDAYDSVFSDLAYEEHVVIVNGEQSIDDVFKNIYKHVESCIGR
jgi:dTMP kinase